MGAAGLVSVTAGVDKCRLRAERQAEALLSSLSSRGIMSGILPVPALPEDDSGIGKKQSPDQRHPWRRAWPVGAGPGLRVSSILFPGVDELQGKEVGSFCLKILLLLLILT